MKRKLKSYIGLFSIELTCSTYSSGVAHFSCRYLSNENKEKLYLEVSSEEIKAGLCTLKPFKALGANGLIAGFF